MRTRSPVPQEPIDADSPERRLDALLAAPVLQPWPVRWNHPVSMSPPRPGILGDRWRSMFAAIRVPARGSRLSIMPPTAGRVGSLASAPALFTRPAWRLPATEPLPRSRQRIPASSLPRRRGQESP